MRPKPRCSNCGKNALKRCTVSVVSAGLRAGAEGYRCQKCDQLFFDDVEASIGAGVALELIRRGIRRGHDFGKVRRQLGMTAVEVGRLLQIAPETLSRWERGNRTIPPLAAFALGSLYEDAERTRARLEALAV